MIKLPSRECCNDVCDVKYPLDINNCRIARAFVRTAMKEFLPVSSVLYN